MAPVKEYIELESGDRMPIVGYGTWQATEAELESAVGLALAAGYRHVDAARAYDNEAGVGRALRAALADGALRREDLFICTKLPPGGNSPERVKQFFDESLSLLGLDYVDLYLLHVPFAFQYVPGDAHPRGADGNMLVDHSTDIIAIWKELEELKLTGRARNIGVSNLNEEQLERVLRVARVRPACLQVEIHAFFQQRPLAAHCARLGIPLVAYSPLGSGGFVAKLRENGLQYPDLMSHPVVGEVARARGRTPAQVLLRHTVERGIAVIPKSTNPQRIKENKSIMDFELTPEDTAKLDALDLGEAGRFCDFRFFGGILDHPEYPFKNQLSK